MSDTLAVVKGRLADGRTIADADVHRLAAEIERLQARVAELEGEVGKQQASAKTWADLFRNATAAIAVASKNGHAEGFQAAREMAVNDPPCTAVYPEVSPYERGRLDAVLEYQRRIRALRPDGDA